MIKNLKKYDTQTTPFVATKTWVLTNESSGKYLLTSDEIETGFAISFIDYNNGESSPTLNSLCSIALGSQTTSSVETTTDVVSYEEGENITGIFYPDVEPKNANPPSYKRLVYHQIQNAFYNNYNDPIKLLGIENIDLQQSETKRFLAENKIRVFTIPQTKFGEKIVEGTVELIDNSLDDNYKIVDDSNGNLFATKNLFSKVQEVRYFDNVIISGSDAYCS